MSQLKTKQMICDIHGDYQAEIIDFYGREIIKPCEQCAVIDEEQRLASEEREKSEKLREKLELMGISKRNYGVDLEKFIPVESQRLARSAAVKFVANFKEMSQKGQTLIYCGGVGTGKTMLVQAMIQSLEFGLYVRAIDISRNVRSTYSDRNISEIEAIKEFVNAKLLVIDEVGVQSQSESESLLITDIIDRRYAEMRPTVLCSNLDEGEMKNVLGERAWDRLKHNCFICPITGNSLRV